MIILLILIADNTVNIYIIIWPFLKCKKYSYLHLSCHLNNLNPTQNVYLRKRLNIFTWSSRRSLIRYANSITFLCLSQTMCPHCPHEWYRDGAISRLATRPQIMTQRMDKLLLHRATRRATSITVFARHARNFGHAGFPRWLHVTLMHGWARARVRARTRRNKGGYITRPRKAQKVQRSPITDATPVPPTFSSLSIGSPDVLFPLCRIRYARLPSSQTTNNDRTVTWPRPVGKSLTFGKPDSAPSTRVYRFVKISTQLLHPYVHALDFDRLLQDNATSTGI